MNLLNKLTIKNLKLNKKRTIVTIIGIILATSLITALSGIVSSFRATMIEREKTVSGDYHYVFFDTNIEDFKYIKNNRNVKSYYLIQDVGYSKLENCKNEYKPYLFVQEYDDSALERMPIILKEGRLPTNSNELIISEHVNSNGGMNYKVGDELTLELGKRTLESGEELDQSNPYTSVRDEETGEYNEEQEKFEVVSSKKYKIVGIMERMNYNIEAYSAPGYLCISYLDKTNISNKLDVYATYKDLDKEFETTAQILNIDKKLLEDYYDGDITLSNDQKNELMDISLTYDRNASLIRWENLTFSDSNIAMLYSVGLIVIIIIMVTGVFCIRNSFAISITEKMKQYGMFASIGATSKQIKKNVLYEAFILGLIGIPLGILSGIFADFVLLKVVGFILKDYLDGIQFVIKISWSAVILAVILSAITIYFSARSSARRAAKISPIEAIRSNQDIKIKAKKIKSPKWVKKIFGIGGDISYKNLKRNKKKYRTTVISIVVSVSIFIAMTSFVNYAFSVSGIYYQDQDYNMVVYVKSKEDIGKLRDISKMDSVSDSVILSREFVGVEKGNFSLTDEAKRVRELINVKGVGEDEDAEDMMLVVIDNEQYAKYAKKVGLSYDDAKKGVILVNETKTYVVENDKGRYVFYDIYNYKKGDTIIGKIQTSSQQYDVDYKIMAVTKEKPMGQQNVTYNGGSMIVTCEEFLEKENPELVDEIGKSNTRLMIYSENPFELEKEIKQKYTSGLSIDNLEEIARQERAIWLVVAIFLYGFITVISLIGITNIFNTITTNMNLRSKEFANLKSIGMTSKEFNRMIRLESIFYGMKSLLIGIPLGIVFSALIYKAFMEGIDTNFIWPIKGIVISIAIVSVLIGCIMKYSLNKINKQNIIETIRKDNI